MDFLRRWARNLTKILSPFNRFASVSHSRWAYLILDALCIDIRFVDTACLNILSYKRTSKSRIEEKLIEFNYLIETSRSSSKRRTNRVVATIINRPLSLSLSVENRATRFPRPCEKKERKDSSPSFSAGRRFFEIASHQDEQDALDVELGSGIGWRICYTFRISRKKEMARRDPKRATSKSSAKVDRRGGSVDPRNPW